MSKQLNLDPENDYCGVLLSGDAAQGVEVQHLGDTLQIHALTRGGSLKASVVIELFPDGSMQVRVWNEQDIETVADSPSTAVEFLGAN